MKQNQKLLLKVWMVLISLFVFVAVFHDNTILSYSAFVPVILFILWNASKLKSMDGSFISLIDVIRSRKWLSIYVIISWFVMIIVAFYFVFTGKNIAEHINITWFLSLAIGSIIGLPVMVQQIEFYKILGSQEP